MAMGPPAWPWDPPTFPRRCPTKGSTWPPAPQHAGAEWGARCCGLESAAPCPPGASCPPPLPALLLAVRPLGPRGAVPPGGSQGSPRPRAVGRMSGASPRPPRGAAAPRPVPAIDVPGRSPGTPAGHPEAGLRPSGVREAARARGALWGDGVGWGASHLSYRQGWGPTGNPGGGGARVRGEQVVIQPLGGPRCPGGAGPVWG